MTNGIDRKRLTPMSVTPDRRNLTPIEEPEPQRFIPEMVNTLLNLGRLYPAAETVANAATSAYGVPVSGLVGLAILPFDKEAAGSAIETVQKYLVYEPQTRHGRELQSAATYPFQKLEQAGRAGSQWATDVTGSPAAGTAVYTAAAGGPALVGVRKPIQSVREGRPGHTRRVVTRGINKGVRPSVVKKEMWRQHQQYMGNAIIAVKEIIKNRDNLVLADRAGNKVYGKLPKTLEQFSQAIEQTKRKVFEEYDALARQAGDSGATISVAPVVTELNALFSDRVLQTLSEETLVYAQKRIDKLNAQAHLPFKPSEVQQMIQLLNQSEKAFYANPSPAMLGKSMVDGLISNHLRASLDAAIEGATGVKYQPLKSRYGALRMLEADVTKRAIVDGRKNVVGLIDYNDIWTAAQLARGLASAHPGFIAGAAATQTMSRWYKWRNDPNQIVSTMFRKVDRTMKGRKRPIPYVGTGISSLTQTVPEEEEYGFLP